jgi:hypothetical protein
VFTFSEVRKSREEPQSLDDCHSSLRKTAMKMKRITSNLEVMSEENKTKREKMTKKYNANLEKLGDKHNTDVRLN